MVLQKRVREIKSVTGRLMVFVLVLCSLLFLTAPFASAEVIVNSQDWKDVYSGLLYSRLSENQGMFVTTDDVTVIREDLLPLIQATDITYIESEDAVSKSFVALLGTTNKNINEFPYTSEINLNLVDELPEVTKFILVDDSVPYNSIPVATYATLDNYYVFFVSSQNIDDVLDKLSARTVDELLLYGNLEPSVKDAVEQSGYPTVIINRGDKYADNMDLLKLYYEKAPIESSRRLMLSTGSFIDWSLFETTSPVLLLNNGFIPEEVERFVQNSPTKVIVVMHPSLSIFARYFNREFGYPSATKIGYSQVTGPINVGIKELNIFPLPSIDPAMSVVEVRYNQYSGSLEVVYENTGEASAYFRAARHVVMLPNGEEEITRVSDEVTYFIQRFEKKVIIYPDVDLAGYGSSDELFLSSDVLFGVDPEAIDLWVQQNTTINFIDYLDSSAVEVKGVVYDQNNLRFEVEISNVGSEVVYADPTIYDLFLNDFRETVSGETVGILPGESEVVYIDAALTEEDIEKNSVIHLEIRYGKDEDALVKVMQQDFEFVLKKGSKKWLLLLLLLLLVYYMYRKMRENQQQ